MLSGSPLFLNHSGIDGFHRQPLHDLCSGTPSGADVTVRRSVCAPARWGWVGNTVVDISTRIKSAVDRFLRRTEDGARNARPSFRSDHPLGERCQTFMFERPFDSDSIRVSEKSIESFNMIQHVVGPTHLHLETLWPESPRSRTLHSVSFLGRLTLGWSLTPVWVTAVETVHHQADPRPKSQRVTDDPGRSFNSSVFRKAMSRECTLPIPRHRYHGLNCSRSTTLYLRRRRWSLRSWTHGMNPRSDRYRLGSMPIAEPSGGTADDSRGVTCEVSDCLRSSGMDKGCAPDARRIPREVLQLTGQLDCLLRADRHPCCGNR